MFRLNCPCLNCNADSLNVEAVSGIDLSSCYICNEYDCDIILNTIEDVKLCMKYKVCKTLPACMAHKYFLSSNFTYIYVRRARQENPDSHM